MEADDLVADYLGALEASDLGRVLALFSTAGVVASPLYGTLPATVFYPALFADTAESMLTLKSVMTGEYHGSTVVSFWFEFYWVLTSGEPAPFTVVDVAELDSAGRIAKLHIVYDTAPLREAFMRVQVGDASPNPN